MKLENLKEVIKFLKTISEENRLKIICLLCSGNKCVCDLGQYFKLPQNLVSHHLKVLKDLNLVSFKKEGLKIFYKLNKETIKKYIKLLNRFLNLIIKNQKI
ncbi:MAG: ArsR/SmtB family transcription factor [Patescibacteria group bacterium]